MRAALLSLTALFGTAAAAGDRHLTPIPERPAAFAFELPGPDGRLLRLADHRGGPVILNFWATWCPPCRAEMPALQRAHAALADVNGTVIAINVGEDAEQVRRFLEEVPLDFPLPLDGDTHVARKYPVEGLPTTYVIDPQGRLAFSAAGERDWDDPALLALIRALAD